MFEGFCPPQFSKMQKTNDQILSTGTNIAEPKNPELQKSPYSMLNAVNDEIARKHRSILNSFGELAQILDNVKQHIINDGPLNAL